MTVARLMATSHFPTRRIYSLQAISDWAKSRTLQEQRRFLPVYDCRDELLQVIRENQVVVVVGETGSGKTTQVRWLQLHVCIADIQCLCMVLQQYAMHVVQFANIQLCCFVGILYNVWSKTSL